jgi:hypothetical protein
MKQTRLQADPAKVAAWQQRTRGKGLSREKQLKRTAKLRTTPRRARPAMPANVREAALRRDGGWCVWSLHLGQRRLAQQVHHLLPQGKDGWPQFAATRENLVGLAADLHMQHEWSPNDRLPWAALPAECREFLQRVARGDARAARLVSTKYPGAELALGES